MLDNDAFVFDCVCHVFNFDMNNAYGKAGQVFINHLYAFHQVLTPPGERLLGPEEFLREWSIDEIAQMVFENLWYSYDRGPAIAAHRPLL